MVQTHPAVPSHATPLLSPYTPRNLNLTPPPSVVVIHRQDGFDVIDDFLLLHHPAARYIIWCLCPAFDVNLLRVFRALQRHWLSSLATLQH